MVMFYGLQRKKRWIVRRGVQTEKEPEGDGCGVAGSECANPHM